ncbi:hypothetical protein J7E93_29255 [Streptomyces sp. ISL-36]|nr:hypothetical protein [Streptomyces sp. ISL-36]
MSAKHMVAGRVAAVIEAGQVAAARPGVQGGPEPSGQLPQDPPVVVGVVVPRVAGVEPVEGPQDAGQP